MVVVLVVVLVVVFVVLVVQLLLYWVLQIWIQNVEQLQNLNIMMKPSVNKPKEATNAKKVDAQFKALIDAAKYKQKLLAPHTLSVDVKLSVCVRRRPFSKKEEQNGEIDSVSCANPQIKIIQSKMKVDGIGKYIDDHAFTFDNTFNENQGNQDIYKVTLKPLVPLLTNKGIVTCFAYGQTGSGKTYTMNGLHQLVVNELFKSIGKNFTIAVSFFELYGGRCLDLLNKKQQLRILEDGNNKIQIQNLSQKSAADSKQLLAIMGTANAVRTTHATVANDTSSRSHGICQILVKKDKETVGKLVLVDLAGSERAHDTQDNNRQRRLEGAQINKSLLALKECIRAMDDKASHVPFRASKLTLILRDSFTSKAEKSKVVMIACISPGSASANHSLNTLRYADRLKDNSGVHQMYKQMAEEGEKKVKAKLKPAKSIIRTGDDSEPQQQIKDTYQAREDFSILKQTLKGQGMEQFFAMQEKISNVLEQEEQLIAVHMATVQKDARLLTQESEMISKIQGDEQYDIDAYVEKLSKMTKKKLKIYKFLDEKIDEFMKGLKQEEEIRKKVKGAPVV